MEFTGEKFFPETHGNIELDHLHRYLLAREFVSGKVVLDIASGEGYGSAMLADWRPVRGASVDVVISGQAFEPIEFFWLTALELARALKPGGLACIIAPSAGPERRHPVDCWRFYPDGMRALADFAQLEVHEVTTQWQDEGYADGSDWWHDSVLVCRKPDHGFRWNMKSNLKRRLQHWVLTMRMLA